MSPTNVYTNLERRTPPTVNFVRRRMTELTFSSAVSTKPSPRPSAIYWKRCAWRSRLPHSWPWLTSNHLVYQNWPSFSYSAKSQSQKSRDRKKELSNQSLVSSVLAEASVFLHVHGQQSTYDLVSTWLQRFIHPPQLNFPASKNGRATAAATVAALPPQHSS